MEANVKKQSIGQFVREYIKENPEMANQDILGKVIANYPGAKTTVKCIAWYKSDLRKKGLLGGGRGSPQSVEAIKAKISDLEAQIEKLKDRLWVLHSQEVQEPVIEDLEEEPVEPQQEEPKKSRRSKKATIEA